MQFSRKEYWSGLPFPSLIKRFSHFSSVQSCPILWYPMNHSMPGLPVHYQLPEFTQTHVHRVGCATQPSHPLSFLSPPAPNPSQHQSFPMSQLLRMRWPKYWSFSFSIIPSKDHPGLISFRMDWLEILAVQGTLKSLLQHHISKASILWHSAFFTIQLSHPYMTTGKTIALTHVQLFATPWSVACQASLSMGILQARILEWVAMPSSRGSSQPRDQIQVSHIAGRFFTV